MTDAERDIDTVAERDAASAAAREARARGEHAHDAASAARAAGDGEARVLALVAQKGAAESAARARVRDVPRCCTRPGIVAL